MSVPGPDEPGTGADLLRRAAKALRERVEGCVINGPWVYRDQRDDPEAYPWQVWAPKSKVNAGTGFAPGTAEFIALMHPPVALALALVLEGLATVIAGTVGDAAAADIFAAELTLARAVLREGES